MSRIIAPDETGSGTSLTQDLAPSYDPSGDLITIPDAHLLFSGNFKRSGHDLVLAGDGKKVVVHDYFAHEKLPTLQSPEGAVLPGKLVAMLAGPEHPGQYALAQPDHAPTGHAVGKAVIGRIDAVSGSVTIMHADGVVTQASLGDLVCRGDVVQTGADGSAGIAFVDGTAFSLSANARMVLNEFDPNGTADSSLISLLQGTFTFRVPDDAGDVKVDTPAGTMGLRGTQLASLDGTVFLDDGTIELSSKADAPHGTFVLLSHDDPSKVLAVVDDPEVMIVLRPKGSAEFVALSPTQMAALQQAYQSAYKTFVQGQDFVQQPNDANTKSTNGGSSSGFGTNGVAPSLLTPFPTFPLPPVLPTTTTGSNSGSSGSGGTAVFVTPPAAFTVLSVSNDEATPVFLGGSHSSLVGVPLIINVPAGDTLVSLTVVGLPAGEKIYSADGTFSHISTGLTDNISIPGSAVDSGLYLLQPPSNLQNVPGSTSGTLTLTANVFGPGGYVSSSATLDLTTDVTASTGPVHWINSAGGEWNDVANATTNWSTGKIPIPGQDFGFGRLIRAQAEGDYRSLQERGRPIVRVRLDDV